MASASDRDSGQPASTFHWDTVFAARFPGMNQAIRWAKSSPKKFQAELKPESGLFSVGKITAEGTFGDWQLTDGGDGDDVNMKVPIPSVILSTQKKSETLTDLEIVIQLHLALFPHTTAVIPGVASGSRQNPQALKVDPGKKDGSPAVTHQDDNFPESSGMYLRQILMTWFNEHISDFQHVFAVADIADQLDKTDELSWLKPTYVTYAVAQPADTGDDTNAEIIEQSVFGMLAMTDNRSPADNQQAVAIDAIPRTKDINAAFLISQNRFLCKMLLHGIYLAFPGSRCEDFEVTEDGTEIQNVNSLEMTFKLNDESHRKATLPANAFSLSVHATQLELAFTDLHFDISPGVTVHVNYSANFEISKADHFLSPQAKLPEGGWGIEVNRIGKPNVNISVTKSSDWQWGDLAAQFAISIGTAVAFAFMPGTGAEADEIGNAVSETLNGASDDSASTDISLPSEPDTESTNVIEEGSSGGTGDSDDSTGDGGDSGSSEEEEGKEKEEEEEEELEATKKDIEDTLSGKKTAPKWKGFMKRLGILLAVNLGGSLVGVSIQRLPWLIGVIGKVDSTEMPTLNNFISNVLNPVVLPYSGDFTLTSITLNESLVFAGKLGFSESATATDLVPGSSQP